MMLRLVVQQVILVQAWQYLHRWFGRIVVVLALLNCYLGYAYDLHGVVLHTYY